MKALVGAGGWGYFEGGLESYAKAFRFVELNVSFYRRVPEAQARRWRARVPAEFTFAVKVHREVTHRDRLRATSAGREAFAHDLRIAELLRAPFVILQTPPDLRLESPQVDGLRNLAAMAGPQTRIGLEARAHARVPLPAELRTVMSEAGILDVVDLSQVRPRIDDDVVYSRLFGPGPENLYEFDDEELRKIDAAGRDAVRVAFTFHGVRMYKDAARFVTFKRTGEFPSATGARGLASLDEALRPDAHFPTSKAGLVRDHGWKVIDRDDRTRQHAYEWLSRLPDRAFRDLDDVISSLEDVPTIDRPATG